MFAFQPLALVPEAALLSKAPAITARLLQHGGQQLMAVLLILTLDRGPHLYALLAKAGKGGKYFRKTSFKVFSDLL